MVAGSNPARSANGGMSEHGLTSLFAKENVGERLHTGPNPVPSADGKSAAGRVHCLENSWV